MVFSFKHRTNVIFLCLNKNFTELKVLSFSMSYRQGQGQSFTISEITSGAVIFLITVAIILVVIVLVIIVQLDDTGHFGGENYRLARDRYPRTKRGVAKESGKRERWRRAGQNKEVTGK